MAEPDDRRAHVEPMKLPPAPEPDPHRDPIAAAIVAEVSTRGPEANAEEMLRRAALPRAEFDRRYEGFDDCLLDTYGRFIASFERAVGGAFNRHEDWRAALRAAAYAAGDWMAASPELMEFGSVGVLQTRNEMVRLKREEVARFCAALIEQGRASAPNSAGVPEGASLIAIGSILNLLTQRIQEGEQVDPVAMVPEMMYVVVRIYLGEEVAREELTLPRPAGTEGRPEADQRKRA